MKILTLASLGFVAVQAYDQHIHADVFNPMNFVNEATPLNLFNNLIEGVQGRVVKDGHIKWGDCAAQVENVYMSDSSLTYCDPDPVKKGDTITFHLGGMLNEDVKMTNTRVSV